MKYTIKYVAGGHTAEESNMETLLKVVREEFPQAVAYDRSGIEIKTDADVTPGIDVLIWENEQDSINDDGARAIASVTVEV